MREAVGATRELGRRLDELEKQIEQDGASWDLVEVAGKMNAAVDAEVERIGHAMVVKLNGGRGGKVPPF